MNIANKKIRQFPLVSIPGVCSAYAWSSNPSSHSDMVESSYDVSFNSGSVGPTLVHYSETILRIINLNNI